MAQLRSSAELRALEGLLAFWVDAGVDCAYADAPVDRLAEGARRLAPPRPAPAAARPAASPPPLSPVGEAVLAARAAAAQAPDLAALEALWPPSTGVR